MIETIICDYLSEKLGVPVLPEHEDLEGEYILVERTGGTTVDFIERATLTFQSYADSLYNAACLNERLKKALQDIVILPEISKAEHNSDYNFTDTETHKYRYQAVYDFYY